MNTIGFGSEIEKTIEDYFSLDMTKLKSSENDIYVFSNGIIIMTFIFSEKIEEGKMNYSLDIYKKFEETIRLELKEKTPISKDYEHIYHSNNEDKIRKLKLLIRKFKEK